MYAIADIAVRGAGRVLWGGGDLLLEMLVLRNWMRRGAIVSFV